jgi:broad specificity phosphatase PhoE
MLHVTYFVHGTTLDNENHISSGWKDVELSELWIQQSYALKNILQDTDFDFVFCSDLIRARKTAEIVFSEKCQIITDTRLRECNYGDYNWYSSDIVEPMQEINIEKPFLNGESYEDVKQRMIELCDFLRENYDGKRIALVAHKAPQLALDVILRWKTWEQAFAQDWRKIGEWQPGWTYESN